jgi:hypothetical protein
VDCLQLIVRAPGAQSSENEPARRSSDVPLRINVLADGYWDLLDILR